MNQNRPESIVPEPGQESVWDYPRPPAIDVDQRLIKVVFNNVVIAETRHALRILETSQPPAFYIPPDDVLQEYLTGTAKRSICEWKGLAVYWSLNVNGNTAKNAAWSYPEPTSRYQPIAGYFAFYPQRVDACYVDDERVQVPEGSFYGGWITSDVVGPFKGGPGTQGW